MTKLIDLSTDQIRSIIVIKKKIEKLQTAVQRRVEKLRAKIDLIAGDGGAPSPFTKKKKRRMSRAGRAAIAAAAKRRWAKYRGKAAKTTKPAAKKRKRFSAAVRAKLAASARARWVLAKKAGKTTL
jgi:midasin (ATPase involved in ribosome maturation)